MSIQDTDQDQAVSLNEELGNIIDGMESEEVSEEEETEEVEQDAEEEEQSEEDEETDDSDEEDDSEDDSEDDEDESEEKLEAPTSWAQGDKEVFDGLDRNGQEFLLRRHKEMETDYIRKTQEIADVRRNWESVDNALQPYKSELARQGMDEAGAVRFMVSWKQRLDQDPVNGIVELAKSYGINLGQETGEDVDPAISAVSQKVDSLIAQNQQRDQQAQQQATAQIQQQVNAFKDETDTEGNLTHPHFETVREDMSALIAHGRATDLQSAYDLAVRLHPDIYDAQIEARLKAEREEEKKKASQDKVKKAAKAKKAASGVRSGSANVKTDPKTLREELESLIQ